MTSPVFGGRGPGGTPKEDKVREVVKCGQGRGRGPKIRTFCVCSLERRFGVVFVAGIDRRDGAKSGGSVVVVDSVVGDGGALHSSYGVGLAGKLLDWREGRPDGDALLRL